MKSIKAKIKVIKEENCGVYEKDDEFNLCDRTLSLPEGRSVCITLVSDITEARDSFEKICTQGLKSEGGYILQCSGPVSGCSGALRFEYIKERADSEEPSAMDDELSCIASLLEDYSIYQYLTEKFEELNFPEISDRELTKMVVNKVGDSGIWNFTKIFKSISASDLKSLISLILYVNFKPGDIVLSKGDPGEHLYIIISGRVEIIGDDNVSLTFLEKGDLFGEMSLLSGEPIGATVRVVKETQLIYVSGPDLRRILTNFPFLQMYFARLLARRLARTNVVRSEESSSGMTGKLSNIPPAELFQILNQNQKTGILKIDLERGTALAAFREGSLILVSYDGERAKEAFFKIIRAKRGRFTFAPGLDPKYNKVEPIADFMWLLMEGLNRIDEEASE